MKEKVSNVPVTNVGVSVRNIGIPGVNLPKESCSDNFCPFHGKIGIRGRLFQGRIIKKTEKTATVEWSYLHYLPRYERYEKRRTRVKAHIPSCIHVNINDKVLIGECRPISKTKKFVILKKV